MEFKFVRCLVYKRICKCWSERWESQLCSAWEGMEDHGCNTPTSLWFCCPQSCHLFCEVSSCTCNSECLCYPCLYSSRSSVSHLLGQNFWCSIRRVMKYSITWEKWWPGDTGIVIMIYCVSEISSQTWKIWSPIAPQLKSKQSFFRKKCKQERKSFIGSSHTLRIEKYACC